jgi:3-methylfumaryl-CoA hydratase
MWAGGRLEFHHLLQVGDPVRRASQITAVSSKQGRSGRLAFVTVRHEIFDAAGLAITEEHDIVYRDAPTPGEQTPNGMLAPVDEHFSRTIVPDPVLLFRYSALTFNGHRIHYDRRYVQTVEQYPGLIVHGPLTATLLLDLLRRERPGLQVKRFEFKGVRPLFDLNPFVVCGRMDGEHHVSLWAKDHLGQLAMDATADLT